MVERELGREQTCGLLDAVVEQRWETLQANADWARFTMNGWINLARGIMVVSWWRKLLDLMMVACESVPYSVLWPHLLDQGMHVCPIPIWVMGHISQTIEIINCTRVPNHVVYRSQCEHQRRL